MRRTIAVEGRPTEDRRELTPGSITLPTERIALMSIMHLTGVIGHEGARLVGYVSDVRREDDGRITAEFSDDLDPHGGYPAIDIHAAEWDESEPEVMRVKAARLRAVTLSPIPNWADVIKPEWDEAQA